MNLQTNQAENKKVLISGNEAVVLGALKAGATYYAGYPITPASEIMHSWVEKYEKNKENLIFLQTEDEISAIHSIMGAALAGRKAFTATSGPGFSLMQEGIGLAYAMKLPIVIVDSQRQGPSTGMPTAPAQADILQTQHGSHGDYNTIVFYPKNVEEAYRYTIEAFNAAAETSSPVILLLDAFISQMTESVVLPEDVKVNDWKFIPLGQSENIRHFTGLTSENNVPRTNDFRTYERWIEERYQNVERAAQSFKFYEQQLNPGSDTLLVSFGIVSRLVEQIVNENPEKYSYFRPIRLFPVLKEELMNAAKNFEKIVVIEANKGQYTEILRSTLLKDVKHIEVTGSGLSLEDLKMKLTSTDI